MKESNLPVYNFSNYRNLSYVSSALLLGQLPEIPSEHYIGVLEPPFASSISTSGVVQVADAFYIYKGDNQVIIGNANSEYAQGFVNSLGNSIGVEVPVEEILVTPGIYLDDPNMLSISSGGPSELCPNCPVVGPDGPDGPDEPDSGLCEYVLSFVGGPCDPGEGSVLITIVNGEFTGWVTIDGEITSQVNFSFNANDGLSGAQFQRVRYSDLDVGLHDIRVVGTFECYGVGSIPNRFIQVDETRTITIGTFCGAKRETIYERWDVYQDETDETFRTTLSSEISYGVFKARITATGFTAVGNADGWFPRETTYTFEQYSQWREDDSSCAKRAFHNETDVLGGFYMASVRNNVDKDNRFWVSGEQWVICNTEGDNGTRPGGGELIHYHSTCE